MEQPRRKMQDIHSKIGPGGGLFSGSLSHTLSRHLNGGLVQVLKCPRCDSLDTKFCYYHNYKLSQPRHFCMTCRRYWTKGGLLRNVPVGGGCRKPKRSSKQNSPSSPPHTATADPPSLTPASNSHSSSESSSITVTNATGAVEAGSGFSSLVFEGGSPMFPDFVGLSGLMTSPSSESVLTSLGFGLLDQEMFDLPVISTVDQAYWSQSQWSADDHDRPNLYIP